MASRISLLTVLITLLLLTGVPVCSSEQVVRQYTSDSLGNNFYTNIELHGELIHITKFKYWLNEISTIPIGKETLGAIVNSGHILTVINDKNARFSAGRTRAPMTGDLINGKGASVEILFDGEVSEAGSHMVYNNSNELVEYTAIINFFHELVHAKHKMLGSWRYFDSEGQAIEEENIFRQQYGKKQQRVIGERVQVSGVPIETVSHVEPLNDHFYPMRVAPLTPPTNWR